MYIQFVEILSWAIVTTRLPKMYCARTWSAQDGMLMDYLSRDWHMADTFKYLYHVAYGTELANYPQNMM